MMLLFSTLLCSCQVQTGKDPVDTDPIDTPMQTDPVTEPPVTEPPVTEPPVTDPVTEPLVTEPPATEPPATEPPVTEPPYPNEEDADVFDYILNRYSYLEFGNGDNLTEKRHRTLLNSINSECKNWWALVDRSCTTDPFGRNLPYSSANMTSLYGYILCMARGYATPGSDY